jgi:hypothetical protein
MGKQSNTKEGRKKEKRTKNTFKERIRPIGKIRKRSGTKLKTKGNVGGTKRNTLL